MASARSVASTARRCAPASEWTAACCQRYEAMAGSRGLTFSAAAIPSCSSLRDASRLPRIASMRAAASMICGARESASACLMLASAAAKSFAPICW